MAEPEVPFEVGPARGRLLRLTAVASLLWLVQIPGNFELTHHYGPLDSPNPTGAFHHLVVDQDRALLIGRGIGDREVNLDSLGQAYVLRPRLTE